MTDTAQTLDSKDVPTNKTESSYWKRAFSVLPAALPLMLVIYALYTLAYSSFLTPGIGEVAESLILTIASFVFLALNGFLFAFVYGADRSREGIMGKMKDGIAAVKDNFGALLSTSVLFLLLTVIGMTFLFIPGILAVIFFYLFPYTVVEQKKRNFEALKESARLVRHGFFRVTAWILVFYAAFLFAAVTVAMLVPEYGERFGDVIGGAVVLPFEALLFYFLYKKLRQKREEVKPA
ncbi:hypothetical protein [Alteribacter natronophilus]|uniref:hypothetical protein n=1 Tax=Alteribacter natronophilus TaxID=2583810 RepID=UPI00110D80EC|nr:hypothetical protein [Alteribacter natronophilus]TMW70684.1 hypothetical protein FGB90_16000 [Alteribacter natronophilus]